jgi:hypothetical protein
MPTIYTKMHPAGLINSASKQLMLGADFLVRDSCGPMSFKGNMDDLEPGWRYYYVLLQPPLTKKPAYLAECIERYLKHLSCYDANDLVFESRRQPIIIRISETTTNGQDLIEAIEEAKLNFHYSLFTVNSLYKSEAFRPISKTAATIGPTYNDLSEIKPEEQEKEFTAFFERHGIALTAKRETEPTYKKPFFLLEGATEEFQKLRELGKRLLKDLTASHSNAREYAASLEKPQRPKGSPLVKQDSSVSER